MVEEYIRLRMNGSYKYFDRMSGSIDRKPVFLFVATRELEILAELIQIAGASHNLPEQGIVWVTTSVHAKSVVLSVENTGEKLTTVGVHACRGRFFAALNAYAPDHAGFGLGMAIFKSITQAHAGILTLTDTRVQLAKWHTGMSLTVLDASNPHEILRKLLREALGGWENPLLTRIRGISRKTDGILCGWEAGSLYGSFQKP
jgi:histidine kinase/DNA gyrase B/HSP90-like ATPase